MLPGEHSPFVTVKGKKFFIQTHSQERTGIPLNISYTSLDLHGLGIEHPDDIKGLSTITNLTQLDLSDNLLEQLPDLRKIEGLADLRAPNNKIRDLSQIAEITTLTFLDLSHNQISSTHGIERLVELEKLSLDSNKIEKIEGFSELINLRKLSLRKNKIKSTRELQNCSSLEVIDLSYNQLIEVEGMSNIRDLHNLNVSFNQIQTIDSFPWAYNLFIDAQNNKITKLYLNDAFNTLDVSDNPIREIEITDQAQFELLVLKNVHLADQSWLNHVPNPARQISF